MTANLPQKTESQDFMIEVTQLQSMCRQLMQTPHYAKLTEAGIFAITQKAKSMGMNVLDALNGGMYFVQGKVEMQGQAMLALIRSKGHSVTIDSKSTNTNVIMHGKRADNGDTWTVEFGIEDAKKAGIYRNMWEKYPKTMCIWRCVSQLGRFLFSDILKNVYVQGEISEAPPIEQAVTYVPEVIDHKRSIDEVDAVKMTLLQCSDEYQQTVQTFLTNQNTTLEAMPQPLFERLLSKAKEKSEEFKKELRDELEKLTESKSEELVNA